MKHEVTAKILITGTHGFVGARAMEKYPHAIPVPSELVRNPGEALTEFVRRHQPNLIVNAAAISDIGACRRDPEGSYSSNVLLPLTLAQVSKDIGAKLLSFSSDQVYTGCTEPGPYSEDTPLPTPANLYAQHKLEAEARVLDILPEAVLLRATWMYDMPLYGHDNRGNFLMNVLSSLMRGSRMQFSDTCFRGITYVRQVVDLFDGAAKLPGGVYNYGSENPLSMFDTAAALLTALGLENRIGELLTKSAPNAPQGHNLWMDCTKLRREGVCFDNTAEGFVRCAEDYRLSLAPRR